MEDQVFKKIVSETRIKGIIQVGANVGQEMGIFKKYTKNIVCFEPVPSVFNILREKNPDVSCYNFALGDKTETKKMYISSNNAESSSFLEPLNHIYSFPNIFFDQNENIKIKRFDELDIDMDLFNVLFSDTQGYEIKVIKGFGEKIINLDYICVEYIENGLYRNDNSLKEITDFVTGLGFKIEIVIPEVEGIYGKVLYKKN